MVEADQTSEECNGEERESKFKRIYFYIITFVRFLHLLPLSTPVIPRPQ